jgi:hypothetical protein
MWFSSRRPALNFLKQGSCLYQLVLSLFILSQACLALDVEIVYRTDGAGVSDWTSDEKAALQYAVDILKNDLDGPIPLKLIATWKTLPRFTLAQGSPVSHIHGAPGLVPAPGFPGIGNGVLYPMPLANQLMGKDLVTEYYLAQYPDGETLRVDFNDQERSVFYFKTDGQVPASKFDFVELAVHELLHAVGFSVQMDVLTGQLYSEGSQEFWDRYSLFVVYEVEFFSDLVPLTALNAAERGSVLASGVLWWDGDHVKVANRNRTGSAILPGGQGKLYTPYPPSAGSTLTHWDSGFSNPEEIMEPTQPYGQALRDIGLGRPLLRDMGWELPWGTIVPEDLDFFSVPTTGPKANDTLPFFIVGNLADGLDVSAITIEGEHAAEFSHDNAGWSGTVELYERRVVNVTFSPTSTGFKRAAIRVSFDNVEIPDTLVSLQGYAIGQDTDGDGISDLDETRDLDDDSPGTQNPFNPAIKDSTGSSFDANPNGFPDGGDDWDNDGMSNESEFIFGYSVVDSSSVGSITETDTDGDGLDDIDETTDIDFTVPGLQLPFDPYWMDSTSDSGQASADGTRDGDNDWDGDGIPNGTEGASDADGDGLANLNDTDADGDGIPDIIETAGDQDGDGTPDYLDTDTDNDGISDIVEGQGDPDSDGIPNFRDLDSDGDGYSDQVENWLGTDPYDSGDFPANLPVFQVPLFSTD